MDIFGDDFQSETDKVAQPETQPTDSFDLLNGLGGGATNSEELQLNESQVSADPFQAQATSDSAVCKDSVQEFLEQEQTQLGDLGADLGLAPTMTSDITKVILYLLRLDFDY